MSDFLPLADQRFISLTTFRRSGVPVSTPVWIARDGEHLLVTTPDDSGKVKRLRHTARVEMRPCSRSGKVDDGATTVPGEAAVLPEDRPDVFRRKYGIEYRIFMRIERLAAGRQKPRVLLRITAA